MVVSHKTKLFQFNLLEKSLKCLKFWRQSKSIPMKVKNCAKSNEI